MVDMNPDYVLEVPDTPDQKKQSACLVSSSIAIRDVDPSPRRKFRIKTRANSTHDPSSQAGASSVLPTHTDADNIFRQADAARALAFPEDSEAKLPLQKSNKTARTSPLNEKRTEKRVLDQSSSVSNHISSSDAGERRRSCQFKGVEVSQQDSIHRIASSLSIRSDFPIPVRKPRSRKGLSFPNRLRAEACPDIGPGSCSEGKDEAVSNMDIAGPSNPPSIVPQRHIGQKRLVFNGCISPSTIAKRSERQEMSSPSGVLHHPHPQHDVYGAGNVIDLTDNSPTIRHGSTINVSAHSKDMRAAERTRTDIAGKALVRPYEYLANGSNCSRVSSSGLNNKEKEISHDLLDNMRIGEANSRRVGLSSAGTTSVVSSSSSRVNPEQGWRTTHNHTSKLPISSMGSGRYKTGRRHNIPVIAIDDALPEVGPSSSGCNNVTSVDPTAQAQLEADELLARQLQEQLYNETPRFVPLEDIDAVIAMSLQHEENEHQTSRIVRRAQYHRRGAQGSHSSVYENEVALTNNIISRLQNTASITLGLGAVFPRYSGASHTQPSINLNDYDALLALDENNHQHTGASESQINSLPQSVVQSSTIEEPCAVCLENPSVGDTIRHLPCFHKFHKECIDEWLRRKKLCPICKSGIR